MVDQTGDIAEAAEMEANLHYESKYVRNKSHLLREMEAKAKETFKIADPITLVPFEKKEQTDEKGIVTLKEHMLAALNDQDSFQKFALANTHR